MTSLRQIIIPADRAAWLALRVEDVTSTESSALFGLNSRITEFELHHQKRDKVVVEIDLNERMDWGTGLQDSIAFEFARKFGVVVRKKSEYIRLPDAQMGASFDFEIVGLSPWPEAETPLQQMFRKHGRGLLEIKNVDSLVFRDKWIKRLDEDEYIDGKNRIIEPPAMIDIQVAHQLHVDGAAWACIGVLVGGNRGEIVYRMRDDAVGEALERRIRKFWDMVKTKQEPQPKFPDDAEFVAKLYGEVSTGRVYDGRGNEALSKAVEDYSAALEREKIAKEDKKVAVAKAMMIIDNAERVIGDGYTISAHAVGPCRVEAYDRKGYRGWKVTKKGTS